MRAEEEVSGFRLQVDCLTGTEDGADYAEIGVTEALGDELCAVSMGGGRGVGGGRNALGRAFEENK